MDELINEFDRIANNTDFNGIKPLAAENGYDAAPYPGGILIDDVGVPIYNRCQNAGPDGGPDKALKFDPTGKFTEKMTFQIGATAGETILIKGQAMTISGIFGTTGYADHAGVSTAGNKTQNVLYVGESTTTYANRTITAIKSAINTVSTYCAKLGAVQNRLEHTINNLKVRSENITAAESRIRDTDMADETNYTKNNILLQAAQSMVSQANAAPQGVRSLLQ